MFQHFNDYKDARCKIEPCATWPQNFTKEQLYRTVSCDYDEFREHGPSRAKGGRQTGSLLVDHHALAVSSFLSFEFAQSLVVRLASFTDDRDLQQSTFSYLSIATSMRIISHKPSRVHVEMSSHCLPAKSSSKMS